MMGSYASAYDVAMGYLEQGQYVVCIPDCGTHHGEVFPIVRVRYWNPTPDDARWGMDARPGIRAVWAARMIATQHLEVQHERRLPEGWE